VRAYFEKELVGYRVFVAIVLTVTASLMWGIGWIYLKEQSVQVSMDLVRSLSLREILDAFHGAFVFFLGPAFSEEFRFRFFSFFLAFLFARAISGLISRRFGRPARYDWTIMMVALVVSSAMFGSVHQFAYIQGFLGFMWGVVYLKCGGWHGKVLKPLCTTTFIHASYNVLITFVGMTMLHVG
jgi:hypothetical protein